MVRFSSHTDSHFCSTFCKQWLCNSWDRLQHRACTSRGIHLVARYSLSHELLCIVGIHELHQKGATWLLCHGSVCWVNYERRGYSLSTLPLLNQPGENTVMATVSASREVVCVVQWYCVMSAAMSLCQPEEDKHVCNSYSSSHLLSSFSSHLAYPGFSEQCEQQDHWHCEQDEQQNNWHSQQYTQDTQHVGSPSHLIIAHFFLI